MGILEYSTTPSSNTTINGIGIAGSSSIKNGDDALRQMMADTASAITKVVDKAAGTYSAVKADHNQLWRATGTVTINLAAAATLTEGWCLVVQADGGNVTVDPAGSEQINGAATLSVISGTVSVIICTGTAFRSYQSFDDTLLGGAAFLDVGTTAGTVAAGDDARLSNAREWTAATVSQTEAETGTATTRRAWTAERVKQSAVAQISNLSVGIGQTWVDVTASRSKDTAYQNTTGKPITVAVSHSDASSGSVQVSEDNTTWVSISNTRSGGVGVPATFIVPTNWWYRTTGSPGRWGELR